MYFKDYTPRQLNYTITDLDRRQAIWAIKQFTSITYAERALEALALFAKGYESIVSNRGNSGWYRENLSDIFGFLENFSEGLALLKKGDKTGYQGLFRGCKFHEYIQGRRFDNGEKNIELGFRWTPKKCVGLYLYAEVACRLMGNLDLAIGEQAFPSILGLEESRDQRFPKNLEPIPYPLGSLVKSKEIVPESGIWIPIHPLGCPNYFFAGFPCTEASIYDGKRKMWDRYANKSKDFEDFTKGGEPTSFCDFYENVPTEWALLWRDDRYQNGIIPDESEYLMDPDYAIPQGPLTAPVVKDEDFF